MQPLAEDDPREIGGFRLLGLLGEGGMGRVFVGRSRGGRLAAVKILRGALSSDTDSVRRFQREIAAARAVSGAFTAPVLGADPDRSPPWLATALGGPSLGEVVRELGPLPPQAIWRLAMGLAEALENVHANGYVHRDLKPANVLLDTDGVKLIDFGVARSADSSMTMAGALIGTFDFMSPEQRQGQRAEPPSDVYSLGCVVAYAASGSMTGPPAAGGMVTAGPDMTSIPVGLRDLVRACLAGDPAVRPEASRLTETEGRSAASPADPEVNYWPEPVASFVGSWQRTLLAEGIPGQASSGTSSETIRVIQRTQQSGPPGGSGGSSPRVRRDGPPGPRAGQRNPDAAARAAEGDRFRLRQRHADAVGAYQASIDLDPADPEVHNDLGAAFCALGRLADAEKCFRRAIDLAPDYLAAHHNLCVTLQEDERFTEAEESARAAIAISGSDPAGFENLGDALHGLARSGEAADAYTEAAALDPGNPRLEGKLTRVRRGRGPGSRS